MRSNLAVSEQEMPLATGLDVRLASRTGALDAPTSGLAPGFVQGNLAILPHDYAEDFLRFCQANPKPCRCSAYRGRAIRQFQRSAAISTSARTSRAIASGAMAS